MDAQDTVCPVIEANGEISHFGGVEKTSWLERLQGDDGDGQMWKICHGQHAPYAPRSPKSSMVPGHHWSSSISMNNSLRCANYQPPYPHAGRREVMELCSSHIPTARVPPGIFTPSG